MLMAVDITMLKRNSTERLIFRFQQYLMSAEENHCSYYRSVVPVSCKMSLVAAAHSETLDNSAPADKMPSSAPGIAAILHD